MVDTNRGANILSAISGLAPLVLGSGDSTISSSATKKGGKRGTQALIDLLNSDIANPNKAGDTVKAAQKNAIELLLQAGVPQIGAAERGSGIYNSSQTRQAMDQLLGQTAAAAAKLEVDQANTSAALQGNTAAKLADLTSKTTQSQTTNQAPTIDPIYSALALAAGIGWANKDSIMGIFSDEPGKPKRLSNDSFAPTAGSDFLGTTISAPATSLFESLMGGFTTDVAAGLHGKAYDPVTGQFSSGDWDDFTDVLTNVGVNTGVNALISSIFGGSSGGGGSTGGDDSGGISFGTVICTALYKQGLLDAATLADDRLFGQAVLALQPGFYYWYKKHATPISKFLIKNKWACYIIYPLVRAWSDQMQFLLGTKDKPNKLGDMILSTGYAIYKKTSGANSDEHTRLINE